MSQDYLRFDNALVGDIIDENKTMTIRYDLDLGVFPGNRIGLLTEGGTKFGSAEIDEIFEMSAQYFADQNFQGHRPYDGVGELLDELHGYYPDQEFRPYTEFDVVKWRNVSVYVDASKAGTY